MIHSIRIHGYRGFNDLTLQGLGQINLLVGKNNSGKSSVLEAIQLVAAGPDPAALIGIVQKRGEQNIVEMVPGRPVYPEFDVCHLFYGHEIKLGSSFEVSTSNSQYNRHIEYKIVDYKPDGNLRLFPALANEEGVVPSIGFAISVDKGDSQSKNSPPVIPLTRNGALNMQAVQILNSMVQPGSTLNAQYIPTESFDLSHLLQIWNKIALTPEEERATRALRALDKNIERISPLAHVPPLYGASQRAGFKVKMTNFKEPVPIGSLGEGVWRMLSLAFGMSRAANGLLLVDEIDTGLHYSVMENMWRLVLQAANELNVQVFATTHSNDCISSLASLCRADSEHTQDITIQRLEPEKNRAVRYTDTQIVAAANQHIEIR